MMKTYMISLGVLLAGIACTSDEIGPANGLYKIWEQQLHPSSSASPLLLTFRQNGQLLYGVAQQEAPCCAPTLFSEIGKRLTFSGTSQRPACALVYCGQSPLSTNSPWTIAHLTDSELVLTANGQHLAFRVR